MYGEMLAKGQRFERLAEGVATSAALKILGNKCGVELPITEAVHSVCYGSGDDRERCKKEIDKLFSRSTKSEWYE
jgi:glycerol-3-phosphate dehydrogenase (NAD(P)+)